MGDCVLRSSLNEAGAHFNAERTRRYLLWRRIKENDDLPWNEGKDFVLFIGLNPSIADEVRLDPTGYRCYDYARRWGYHFLLIGNLYAKISTVAKAVDFKFNDPDDRMNNDNELAQALGIADDTVLAWGTNADEEIVADFLRRTRQVKTRELRCLGVNKNGSPKHPLYVSGDSTSVLDVEDLK